MFRRVFAKCLFLVFFLPERPHPEVMNALHPDRMSADERLAEVADLLALGLVRLRARQSSRVSAPSGESSLDCAAHPSGPVPVPSRRKRA